MLSFPDVVQSLLYILEAEFSCLVCRLRFQILKYVGWQTGRWRYPNTVTLAGEYNAFKIAAPSLFAATFIVPPLTVNLAQVNASPN